MIWKFRWWLADKVETGSAWLVERLRLSRHSRRAWSQTSGAAGYMRELNRKNLEESPFFKFSSNKSASRKILEEVIDRRTNDRSEC